ncbi:G-protein coupled receptor 84 [Mustelus asterias]
MDANSSFANLSCHPDVVNYRYFGALLGILVTAVGTVGNVMTLLAFATEPRLRSRFNLLILNLTTADLIYCGLLQPVTVDTFIHFHWRQGAGACRAFGLALFVANSVSIFSLILIAMSRYILISDGRRFDRLFTRLSMPFILATPWLLGLSLFGPLWNIYVFVPPVCTCSFHRSRGRPYTTVLMFLMFVAGLSSIGLFYFLIHRKVRAAARALEAHRPQGGGKGAAAGKRKSRLAELSAQDSGIAESHSVDSLATETSTAGPADGPNQGEAPHRITDNGARKQSETPPIGKNDTRKQAETPPIGNDDTRKQSETPPIGKDDTRKQAETPPIGNDDTRKQSETPPIGNDDTRKQSETPPIGNDDTRKQAETPPIGNDDTRKQGETPRVGDRKDGAPSQGEAPQCKRGSSGEFKRVTRMCFAMFLVYVTCYFPFCILHVADGRKRAPILLHMVAGNCTWLNSCINPILYAVMNRQFRDAYRGVLRKAANLFGRLRGH